MGCGQSHIGNIIYPRKSKNKEGSKRNGDGSGDEEEKDEDADSESEEARLRAARLKQLVQVPPGPLLDQSEISSSQSDFFKMLDEKIANGPDYDSDCEYERAMEHARLCRLLQDWEVAKERSRYRYMDGPTTHYGKPLRYMPMNGGIHYHHPPQYYQYQHYPQQPQPNYHPHHHHHHYPLVNSVVTYDYNQDAYYTKLA